jgi:hypothetical protein
MQVVADAMPALQCSVVAFLVHKAPEWDLGVSDDSSAADTTAANANEDTDSGDAEGQASASGAGATGSGDASVTVRRKLRGNVSLQERVQVRNVKISALQRLPNPVFGHCNSFLCWRLRSLCACCLRLVRHRCRAGIHAVSTSRTLDSSCACRPLRPAACACCKPTVT